MAGQPTAAARAAITLPASFDQTGIPFEIADMGLCMFSFMVTGSRCLARGEPRLWVEPPIPGKRVSSGSLRHGVYRHKRARAMERALPHVRAGDGSRRFVIGSGAECDSLCIVGARAARGVTLP
jgi:hypothetical protein